MFPWAVSPRIGASLLGQATQRSTTLGLAKPPSISAACLMQAKHVIELFVLFVTVSIDGMALRPGAGCVAVFSAPSPAP